MATEHNFGHTLLQDFFLSQAHLLGSVKHTAPVSGGCINTCLKLKTTTGTYFLKYNNANTYPGMMAAEVHGLQLLRNTQTIGIPKVLVQLAYKGIDFLLLEWIEPATEKTDYWELFGQALAALHKNTAPYFGLEANNYIGSLPQDNTPTQNGTQFFIDNRLQPQLQIAIDSKQLPRSAINQFEILYSKLPNLIPNEPPALLHGDLWEGNYLTGPNGEAWLVDPSVQYGFREAEIAYTKLFGPFNYRFYDAYNAAFPLKGGFIERADLYNLYPLLVHVNLFGGGYANQVMATLYKYL